MTFFSETQKDILNNVHIAVIHCNETTQWLVAVEVQKKTTEERKSHKFE